MVATAVVDECMGRWWVSNNNNDNSFRIVEVWYTSEDKYRAFDLGTYNHQQLHLLFEHVHEWNEYNNQGLLMDGVQIDIEHGHFVF